jgi:hypothetical protein
MKLRSHFEIGALFAVILFGGVNSRSFRSSSNLTFKRRRLLDAA